MKKLLSVALSLILAMSFTVSAFAASTVSVGSDDFEPILGLNGKKVTRLVKGKKQNYSVTGIYIESESKAELTFVNRARREKGLSALKWDAKLEEPAIQRALEQYIQFSHTRPDGSSWNTVDSHVNGENLAISYGGGYLDAESVTEGWLNSPGHYTNIMGTNDASKYFVSMAAACVETDKGVIWVQLFHADAKISGKTGEVKEPQAGTPAKDSSSSASGSSPVSAKSIVEDLGKAKASGSNVPLTVKGVDRLSLDVIKAAADWGVKNKKAVLLMVPTLTSAGKTNQGILTMNPARFTKNKNAVKTGVYIEKSDVKSVSDKIAKKYPKAKFAVVRLEQNGSYGGTVDIGAKADVSKLDTKALLFYGYDEKTGKLTKLDLGDAGYSIDKNKYLRFPAKRGGYIIVTDKAF